MNQDFDERPLTCMYGAIGSVLALIGLAAVLEPLLQRGNYLQQGLFWGGLLGALLAVGAYWKSREDKIYGR